MNARIKALLKRTPLYPVYRRIRERRYRVKAVRAYWQWNDQDERMASFYRQFIRPGDLVFDVGANRGNRTKIFHRLQAKVVAFEPQSLCADYLEMVYARCPSVQIVREALGPAEGQAEMLLNEDDVFSSFSADWVSTVERTGRFRTPGWNERKLTQMTTLDKAIRQYGLPAFIKIDVEGYELEVLSGLSTPIACISVEFTAPEYVGATLKCLDHMSTLGIVSAQLSFEESMQFELPTWVSSGQMKHVLGSLDRTSWGDVYVRCQVID